MTFNDKKMEAPPQDLILPIHPSPPAQFATCSSCSNFLEVEQRITVFITQNLTIVGEHTQNWLCLPNYQYAAQHYLTVVP